MTARFFKAHGEFCATHPWEVIVAILTLTACMLTVEQKQHVPPPKPTLPQCVGCLNEAEYNAADVIVMTLIRCLAILYSYYQFCNLRRLGSKYILGIAGLFTVFSSFVFTSTVLNFLRIDVSDLKDALFCFLLLIDLSKAAILAEFALGASNQEEVTSNIARGMSLLAPTITLDTIVETLVIGVGTLSGVHRLEMLSCFACLSVVVNYGVFMTFYPACLSLILELSRAKNIYGKKDIKASLISMALKEEEKSNPVVQRVKLIMSVGLMLVHARSLSPFRNDTTPPLVNQRMTLNLTDDTAPYGYIMKWITLSADHIVILILLLALVVKFIFFENKEDFKLRVRKSGESERCDQLKLFRNTLGMPFALPKALEEKEVQTPEEKSEGKLQPSETIETLEEAVQTSEEKVQTLKEQAQTLEEKLQTLQQKVPTLQEKEVQTDNLLELTEQKYPETRVLAPPRSLEECLSIYKSQFGASTLTDEEVIMLVHNKHILAYQLEKAVGDCKRGVGIRRQLIGADANTTQAFTDLPYKNYDYSKVMGACCENVIGYMPIPVGIAGPLLLDGRLIYVPMATTEGCLVASTNRGSRALLNCGVKSAIVADGMTRGPVVRFPSLVQASNAVTWLENPENYAKIKASFDSTSRFARLNRIHSRLFGRLVFIRFVAKTGDAMGMNMLSKGTELALKCLLAEFPEMEILSLSGNFCADKKPAAVNWIEGRGKSVVCEAIVPGTIVQNVLKTSVNALVDVHVSKNMIGSAVAGSIGGFNAHAANIVTAIYIATGQDPAQNVVSSNCMTIMEKWGDNEEDLYISCTMPSLELGTIGGGTILPPQAACLEMLGVRGANVEVPGENAKQLARIVCATVLAGELSLMAALTAGHLVQSHLRHNRSTTAESQELCLKSQCIPAYKHNVV